MAESDLPDCRAKGVAALQEAGKLPSNLVDFPRVDLLGIYPNMEGLGVQLSLVILAIILLWNGNRRHQRTSRKHTGAET